MRSQGLEECCSRRHLGLAESPLIRVLPTTPSCAWMWLVWRGAFNAYFCGVGALRHGGRLRSNRPQGIAGKTASSRPRLLFRLKKRLRCLGCCYIDIGDWGIGKSRRRIITFPCMASTRRMIRSVGMRYVRMVQSETKRRRQQRTILRIKHSETIACHSRRTPFVS